MTENQKEMIRLWTDADEDGKAMRACVARYKAILREGATV